MPRRGLFLFIMPIFLWAWFFISGGTAKAADAIITENTVWAKGEVRVIDGVDGLIIMPGAKLTVEAGAIIKLAPNNSIVVMGELEIKGSASEPVIITSLRDDNAGGDTNGDGMATTPAPGDWYSIVANDPGVKIKIDYAKISYGGSYYDSPATLAAINQAAEFSVEHSSIINNSGYIMIGSVVSAKINYSNIYNPDFCLSEDPFGMGIAMTYCGGSMLMNTGANLIDAANNYWGHEDGPTLIEQLSGPADIKGTAMGSNITYEPYLTAVWAAEPAELEPVILVPGIMGSWEVNGEWKLDPILRTYDNLWQALKLVGYEEGKTLFAFPYQWRQDNTLTAYQLKQKIDEVKSICDCDKVDIVAHSMGGLVARAYAESDYYGGDIDQLVFLGTPHKGSPEAYLRWEAGEGFEGVRGVLVKLYFSQEAKTMGYSSLFEYIQDNVVSVEQLLPDYAYLQNSGETGFRIYDKNGYPNNYPYNSFLENINSIDKINQFTGSGIKIMNFIGDTGNNTINAIKVSSGEQYWPMWKHGYAEEAIRLTGDGTVPEISSSLFIPTKVDSADHSALPTKAQSRVIEYLAGSLPTVEITDIREPEKIIVVRIFSPADFVIIAPNGKRLGKDFTSDPAVAVNEIPGAFYSGFDSGAEFAVIPDPLDGEYEVRLQGTDQGEYKLSASLISENNQVDQEFSGSIAPDQPRDFNIVYSAMSENPLSELEPIDTVPPVITINKPLESDRYLHSNDLIIDYTASDDFSGIATTTITIDGQAVATTTVDLFDYALGQHNLIIQVVDQAGNQAQAQVGFKIIANIASTISDIEEIHKRGWLKGRLYKPLLISAFRLLDIEAKYFNKEQDLIEKLIRKTQDDEKLTDKKKQKLIEQYNKKLDDLERNRARAIDRSLDVIEKLLDAAKKQNQLNQQGYDIIISDINYLRENL